MFSVKDDKCAVRRRVASCAIRYNHVLSTENIDVDVGNIFLHNDCISYLFVLSFEIIFVFRSNKLVVSNFDNSDHTYRKVITSEAS